MVTAWLMVAPLVNAATPEISILQRRPAGDITQLTSDLVKLQRALTDLTAQTAALTADAHEALFAGVPLEGSWHLTLPAGFEEPVEIRSVPAGRLQFDVRGVMRGVYRRDGHLLRMAQPADERLTEFVWAFVSPDRLMLIESPPVAKIGSDYRGATLDRVEQPPRDQRESAGPEAARKG